MYGYYYLMFATFPILFTETYGFSTGTSGLVRCDDILHFAPLTHTHKYRPTWGPVSGLSFQPCMVQLLPTGYTSRYVSISDPTALLTHALINLRLAREKE